MQREKNDVAFHLVKAAAQEGLEIFLWREHNTFPLLSGHDLDVLVSRKRLFEIEQFLKREISKIGWKPLLVVRFGSRITYLLGRENATPGRDGDFLQLDLHTALTVGGIPYVSSANLIKRCRIEKGIYWLDRVDGATVSFLERFLSGVDLKPGYKDEWNWALLTDPDRVRELLIGAVGEKVASALLRGDHNDRGTSKVRRRLVIRSLVLRFSETLRVLRDKVRDSVRNFFHPTGEFWTICGPDGAGKSTIISKLEKLVEGRLAIKVYVFHSRPYLIPRLAHILPMRKHDRKNILNKRSYESRQGVLKSWTRLIILFLDYHLGYWILIRPLLGKGDLVLFDRFAQDYLVDPRIRGISVSSWILNKFLKLAPKGDKAIFVVASPESLVDRKGELTLEEAENQLRGYEAIARVDPKALTIDTERMTSDEAANFLASSFVT